MKKPFFPLIVTLLLTSGMPARVRAQSLSGLHVGDDASRLATLGPVAASDKYKSFVVRKWKLANGNELSVTTDSAGKIVYIESDWGYLHETTGCDLPGLKFGVTTLTELRKRFGSNGLGFKERGRVITIPDAIVMMNAYEFGPVVVTFFTRVNGKRALREAGIPVSDRARLDSISLADRSYAQSEWGEPVYDPEYKKTEWK